MRRKTMASRSGARVSYMACPHLASVAALSAMRCNQQDAWDGCPRPGAHAALRGVPSNMECRDSCRQSMARRNRVGNNDDAAQQG